jgi:hypothetical protein
MEQFKISIVSENLLLLVYGITTTASPFFDNAGKTSMRDFSEIFCKKLIQIYARSWWNYLTLF